MDCVGRKCFSDKKKMLILKIWSCRCPNASSSKCGGFLLRHRQGSFQTKLYPFPLAPERQVFGQAGIAAKRGSCY